MLRQALYSVVIATVALAPVGAAAQDRAAKVVVDVVDVREIRDTQTVIGQLVATRRSTVATRIAGIVDSVAFEVGDQVRKDQALVTLDNSRIRLDKSSAQASVRVAEAAMRVAETRLKLAEQTFARQEALAKSAAFSRSRYQDLELAAVQSRNEYAQAEAQLQSVKSSLELAEYELSHTVIKAPFEGIIISQQAQPGQYVAQGGTVATLLDINNLEVEADVPANIANGLREGVRVEALFEGGARRQVVVRSTIPVQNVSTRTRPVRFSARFDDLGEFQIAIGSSVSLQMPVSAARKVVSAPKDALLQAGGSWIVYVVEDGVAKRRAVALGQAVGERMEITSGLQSGEMVVVRGNERLRPGQPVAPVRAPAGNGKTQG